MCVCFFFFIELTWIRREQKINLSRIVYVPTGVDRLLVFSDTRLKNLHKRIRITWFGTWKLRCKARKSEHHYIGVELMLLTNMYWHVSHHSRMFVDVTRDVVYRKIWSTYLYVLLWRLFQFCSWVVSTHLVQAQLQYTEEFTKTWLEDFRDHPKSVNFNVVLMGFSER